MHFPLSLEHLSFKNALTATTGKEPSGLIFVSDTSVWPSGSVEERVSEGSNERAQCPLLPVGDWQGRWLLPESPDHEGQVGFAPGCVCTRACVCVCVGVGGALRNRSYCSFIRICWGRCQLVPINTFIFSNSLDAFSKAGAAKPRIGDMAQDWGRKE